jgi:hypothetical protein
LSEFTSVEDITLGAKYKDAVSGVEGIAVSKTQCLTGCDRVTLSTQGDDPKHLTTDVTTLDYVDSGVSERFQAIEAKGEVKPGGPATIGSAFS